MTESRHEELRAVARDYLKTYYKFTEDEIHNEYTPPDAQGVKYRVDVAAINAKGFKVAVELGHCSIYKLYDLYNYFDDVVWIPYWINVVTGEEDLEAKIQWGIASALSKEREEMKQAIVNAQTEQRAKAEANESLLYSVLWTVFSKVQDNAVKAEIGKLLEGSQFKTMNFQQLKNWGHSKVPREGYELAQAKKQVKWQKNRAVKDLGWLPAVVESPSEQDKKEAP